MKKIIILLMLVFMGVLLLTPLHPGVKKVAQTGLQFLKVDVGARAAAMGGSYIMVGNDASAIFYNPAGIARSESNIDFFLSNTQWIAEINYISGAVTKNFGSIGTFGLSYATADYGDDIIGTRYADSEIGYVETGKMSVGAFAIGLSYARAMTNKFTIGGQIKYAYQNLGENTLSTGKTSKNEVSGLAYDFGTIFYPGFRSLRIGMSIRNFSPEFKYVEEGFELPLTFILGAAIDVMDFMDQENNSLLISLDALHPRDYTERINLGAEYWFMKKFALRAGYKFNYDTEGLSAGFGIKQNIGFINLLVDYAYSDAGEYFDAIHRFSIGGSF